MRKRTHITLERSELSVIGRSVQRALAWCDQCREAVQMISPDQARVVAGLTARQIYRWIECGRVHFRETPDGRVSICLKSLY